LTSFLPNLCRTAQKIPKTNIKQAHSVGISAHFMRDFPAAKKDNIAAAICNLKLTGEIR